MRDMMEPDEEIGDWNAKQIARKDPSQTQTRTHGSSEVSKTTKQPPPPLGAGSQDQVDQPSPSVSCGAKLQLCHEEILIKLSVLLANVYNNPWKDKYKIVYASNPRIRDMLVHPGCGQLLMQHAGFERRVRPDDNTNELSYEEALALPHAETPDFNTEESVPFSERDVLVIPKDSERDDVKIARGIVDKCLQDKAQQREEREKKAVKKPLNKSKTSDTADRERILQKIKEDQQELKVRVSAVTARVEG
eukprot:TRINITY_DN7789_c0_g1_i5.p1 TRINITY_DN7789_c0_g1~~TRINITY_DN7789_c0_g1_i5.p1  ORF type:complete len:248 (+),score=70.30 TRINITY_DN7789_c0_g1_i5:336-1079(+)